MELKDCAIKGLCVPFCMLVCLYVGVLVCWCACMLVCLCVGVLVC